MKFAESPNLTLLLLGNWDQGEENQGPHIPGEDLDLPGPASCGLGLEGLGKDQLQMAAPEPTATPKPHTGNALYEH